MRLMYFAHILAGSLALVTGYVALYAAKGATLHRKTGMVFVYAMLTMTVCGMMLAAAEGGAWAAVNFRAALLTAYLVVTALTTVRRPAHARWLDVGGMLVALAVGLISLTFGFEALASGGSRNGVPAFPFFLFGAVGLIGSAGDARMIGTGISLRGAPRIARHLWRMSFALLIAAMSFFFGQAKVIPKPIRIPALLALPVLAVLVTMLYWLWRVRIRRSLQGIVRVRAPETA